MMFFGYDYPGVALEYSQSAYMQHVLTKAYEVSSLREVTWTVDERSAIEVPVAEETCSCEVKREKVLEVYFDFNSAKLKDSERDKLLSLEPGRYFLVGHACWIGSEKYNDKLSLKRAYSVAELLRSMNFEVVGLDYRGERECNLHKDIPVRKAKSLLGECRKVEVYRDVP